ncbi:zinc-binding dehydrogenase [Paraburkholderia sp.]|uniref:zinc-binding dehydrogenase n=1 Tax=Paraburkholderia sp. TaxID=1926495 RepID=UPI0039E2F650
MSCADSNSFSDSVCLSFSSRSFLLYTVSDGILPDFSCSAFSFFAPVSCGCGDLFSMTLSLRCRSNPSDGDTHPDTSTPHMPCLDQRSTTIVISTPFQFPLKWRFYRCFHTQAAGFSTTFCPAFSLQAPFPPVISRIFSADAPWLSSIGIAPIFPASFSRQLSEIAALIDAGNVRLAVAKRYAFDASAKALDRLAKGHVRGKIVVEMA